MANLFNNAALAEQLSIWSGHSSTAIAGCDGEVMMIDRNTYTWVNTKLTHSGADGTLKVP